MAISAKDVNELRKATGAGFMDCKKALTESNGDIQAAIDYLRKKGQKVSELRAGREANEGVVIAKTTADSKRGVVLYLSCETDFVARNDEFIQFADKLTQIALDSKVDNNEDILKLQMNGSTIKDNLAEKVGAIGENIGIASVQKLEGDFIVPYIHAGNKIGVLVSLNQPGDDSLKELGRDVAMQVAAMDPVALNEDEVSEEVKTREIQIGREQAKAEGKPENMLDRIADGKLKRFFKDNTLVNQPFVKDQSKTVGQVLADFKKDLKVTGFKRVALGNK